jgi:hypothetical protein
MIRHKLPNKTKSVTVAEPKKTLPTKQGLDGREVLPQKSVSAGCHHLL